MCRLYDFHPHGQEDLLIETMKLLKWTGDPWEDVFSAQVSSLYVSRHITLTIAPQFLVFPSRGRREFAKPFFSIDLARC